MRFPKDIANIILDMVSSMLLHELHSMCVQEIKKQVIVGHLKTFHSCCVVEQTFSPFYCLACIRYLNRTGTW